MQTFTEKRLPPLNGHFLCDHITYYVFNYSLTVSSFLLPGGMFCSGMDLSVVATANETGYMDWCDAEQRGPMVGDRIV